MAVITTITPLSSAARTTSGTVDLGAIPGEHDELLIYVNATTVTGTSPSMTVTYQASPDGTTFFDRVAGTAITAAGKQVIQVTSGLGKYGRLSYTITGTTPSFTFDAVVQASR